MQSLKKRMSEIKCEISLGSLNVKEGYMKLFAEDKIDEVIAL